MKIDPIPTRRKPLKKTFYARLFNKAKFRKQHASAAAAAEAIDENAGINISRSLSIIFTIHILAIGMIFIHKQYLSGRTQEPKEVSRDVQTGSGSGSEVPAASPERADQVPGVKIGGKPYMVKKGDNFAVIAAKFQVDESELRKMNHDKEVRAGTVLRIPDSKRIVAVEPPEVRAIRDHGTRHPSESGLVEILPQTGDARRLSTGNGALPVAVANHSDAKTHVVKPGESIWKISKQYDLTEKELMAANGISDPAKLRAGQVLKLPSP